MSFDVRLGTPTDYLDLTDIVRHAVGTINNAADWLDMPEAPDGATQRTIAFTTLVSGATPDAMLANVSAIQQMLNRAVEANRSRKPASERVSLQFRLNTTGWTYADVLGGRINPHTRLPDGRHVLATVTLACQPAFRTDAVQAQNLLSAACDPERSVWTLTNVTATSNNATAPDGSETAATLRETADSGTHEIRQEITKDTASETYTLSAYVKADGRDAVSLYLADSTGTNGAYVIFDVAAGYQLYPADVNGTGFSAADGSIEPVGDGWYRCILTATSNADAALRAYVQLHNGSGTSYAGNASLGLLVWGIQVEESDSAGLLLVPEMLPDTVTAERIIPGDVVPSSDEMLAIDPDNLIASATSPTIWDTFQANTSTTTRPASATTGQAIFARETTTASAHYVYIKNTISPATATVSAGVNTLGIYIASSIDYPTPACRLLFSGNDQTEGYYVTIDFAAGTVSAPTLRGGTGYSGASSEIIALADGWFWVRITQTMPATTKAGCYITMRDSNAGSSYTGTGAAVKFYAPQIVAGATIDKPAPAVVGYEEESTVIPAETIATGKQGGAYIWPVPGDADALYRVEMVDASTTTAVNRVHIGAWQGRLNEGQPFTLLNAVEGSSVSTGGLTQVGTWVPGVSTDDTWRTIGAIDSTCNLPDGRYDVIARVRDTAQNIGSPRIRPLSVTGAIYARQVARESHKLDPDHRSLTLPISEPTRQGSTLVLMAQAIGKPGAYGTPQMTASVTNGGGLTWTSLFPSGPAETLGKAQAWYVTNAAPVGTEVTVKWSREISAMTVTASLVEIVGAAPSSLDATDTDYKDSRTSASLVSGVAEATPSVAGGLALSFGGGWNDWANPFTNPTIDGDQWYSVSSLTSGSIYARPITATFPIQAQWRKIPVIGMFPDPIEEGWYVLLALFKAAASSGSSIGTGQWSVQVTAITAGGVESLPSERMVAQVVSSGAAVSVAWDPPENGTPAKYRIYRNRGTGWGYFETADASATSYVFTTETGITAGSPPSQTSTIAALRLAVSPASGSTIAVGRTASVRRANGIWEPIALGSITLPPVAPGEGTMPDGWQVHVQARNEAKWPVECNGLWLISADDGQVQAWRPRLNGTVPRGWIVDTARDELTTAVLMDGASDAGQLALVPGVLTLRSGGGAHISVRPDIADGVSDLVNADLRISRVLVTPRHRYLSSGGGA